MMEVQIFVDENQVEVQQQQQLNIHQLKVTNVFTVTVDFV